jgi:hypothetical protein
MTAQVPEKLVLNGQPTVMTSCPSLPGGNTRIVEIGNDILCTACWRRYVGTWEVLRKRFYLVELAGKYRIIGPGAIFAAWYTGVLRVPRGQVLHHGHMGICTVYEKELLITVEQGYVAGYRLLDNRRDLRTTLAHAFSTLAQ